MVAAVPEMQAAGNQKQCFDMLVVRLMHIADMPSVPEILQRQQSVKQSGATPTSAPQTTTETTNSTTVKKLVISNANDLATALQASKEILLYSYYTSNLEVVEVSDGIIKYFDRRGDADFAHKMAAWLDDKTGRTWTLERVMESPHAHTITEQKKEELEADPLVASAMDLFADAEIVGVK